jgi:uncharacterized sulfatase
MLAKQKLFVHWCLFYFGIPFLILLIGRICFFLYYQSFYSSYTFWEIALNLAHGIRFDLALSFALYGSPFLLLLLFPKKWQVASFRFFSVCLLPITVALIFVQLIGIAYFQESGRHLSFEILFLFSDFFSLIGVALRDYKFLIFIGILFLIFFFYSFFFIFTRLSKKKYYPTYQKKSAFFIFKEIIKRVALFLFVVLCARGGWQLKPLSSTHAFYHGDQKLGSLAFGAPFSLVQFLGSLSSPATTKQWLPEKEAAGNTKKLLSENSQDVFLKEAYPFYRKRNFADSDISKKNLVIIVMESWGANYIAALKGKDPEVTPYFDSLSTQGLMFENFFSSGSRSVQGVSSIMFSLPSIEKIPIYKTPFVSNRMSSLPETLAKEGYESIFFHAGKEGTLYLHNLARVAKYQKVFSLDNLENSKERFDGTWGLWDHFAFSAFARELGKLQPPFHGMFFSLTSHAPYSLPSKKFEYFKSDRHDYEFLNTLKYSDWALKQFFEEAKKYDWYQNTIFFIVADHNRGAYKDKKLSYHIPLLIFSPAGDIPPQSTKVIGSQIDITPTALALLGVKSPFAAAGKNLLDFPQQKSYALVSTNIHYWITPNYIYAFENNKLKHTRSFQNDLVITIDLQEPTHKQNIQNFFSLFQTSFNAILNNKVFPLETSK